MPCLAYLPLSFSLSPLGGQIFVHGLEAGKAWHPPCFWLGQALWICLGRWAEGRLCSPASLCGRCGCPVLGVSSCSPGQSSAFAEHPRASLSFPVPPWYPSKARCGELLPVLLLGPQQALCLGRREVVSGLPSCSQSSRKKRCACEGSCVPGAPKSSRPLCQPTRGLSGFDELPATFFFLFPLLLSLQLCQR